MSNFFGGAMSNLSFLFILCVVVGLARPALASPLRPPYDHVFCSTKGYYCAYVSSSEGVKVFKVEGGKSIEPSYTIPGLYLGAANLSDDGQTIVKVQNPIEMAHVKDAPAVLVWVGGNLYRKIYMTEILSKWKALKTSDGYVWCKSMKFENDGRFIIELIDGTKYEIKVNR